MKALAGWLAACFAAAAIGAMATRQAPEFYAALARPDWAPPAWVFAPVWTVLYALMGIAAWRVWRRVRFGAPLMLFSVQLGLNALWSWLFFAWRMGAAAFFEILLLWILIAATTAAFWRVDRPAGALLIPYLAWVGFAAALTWTLWRGNPALL
ncbi:MAG TPA: TspO/MBR family protein [Burkholderiales bacterium]|nr:TspO/MBR family protein [Burkholderiales bacterium]